MGFKASGKNGYHGYAWRHKFTQGTLDIWLHDDPPATKADYDIETVEAEIVFLARLSGQWPAGQTEIHFHPSTEVHRKVAADIWAQVRLAQRNIPARLV